MGVRLSTQEQKCCLFDSTMDLAFGPVFDTEEEAQLFLEWYEGTYEDPRVMWFRSHADQLEFIQRYGFWYRATRDERDGTFREDIAIQMSRDATPDQMDVH